MLTVWCFQEKGSVFGGKDCGCGELKAMVDEIVGCYENSNGELFIEGARKVGDLMKEHRNMMDGSLAGREWHRCRLFGFISMWMEEMRRS